MSLEFGVLGPIEVRSDGEVVALGGPQQRRIVAALIAERGQVVPVDRLVEAAWSDEPPDGARRTVMTYVSRLRLAIGEGAVLTQDPGYRLVAADDAIDAARFEQLVDQARSAPPTQAVTLIDAALGLWRGRAFGEFADEWWALPHATRLEELRIVAAEQRADALIAVGAYDRAVADLERLVVTYSLRERSVAQLMRAYESSGRQADALRAYVRYRDDLAEETGLEPSEALRDLESSIVVGRGATTGGHQWTRGYELGEVIGEGSFGTVYKSTQPGVGREVAIKVIRAELANDPTFARRFEAEAEMVAHLEHPHIVPLYDFWREPGGAYLVFRLLRGGTAHDWLERDGPMDLERASRFVTEVGGALAAAHAAGVVHRDVKPENVLFDDAGNPYLADFGIAAVRQPNESAIAGTDDDADYELMSAGSPLYAPPEQFQRVAPSPLGDQYSFAVMVWELLTGTAPFDGTSSSTILRAKLERPVASLRFLRPDLPGELDEVLQRATATRAADRFDDMTDLLDAWRVAVRAAVSATANLGATPQPSSRALSSTVTHLDDDVANPYKGLRAFGEVDVAHFCGRDALVGRLVDEVEAHSFVAIVGASGSGKSSVVHAGLVPRLRAADRRVVSMVPGDDPMGQLRIALLTVAVEDPVAGGVARVVRSVAEQAGGPLVVVIDQFEELWTLAPDDERERFLRGLAALVEDAPVGLVRVIVTIRADFFDRPLTHPALGRLIAAHPFAVTPMTAAELHEAVVTPAAAAGVVFEPGLDSAIVAEVANQPAGLPLLQFTLSELFDRRQGQVIARSAYDAMGGIGGAIGTRAEEIFTALDAGGQEAARRLLLRLVVPGDGTEDTRRRLRYSDLPQGTIPIAELFEAHRLLVADRDPTTREPTVEVAHESLLRSWPRLRDWLREDRDLIRQVQHVGFAAEAWARAGRPASELYRGGRLDAAAGVLDTRPQQFTSLERDFVEAGIAASVADIERDQRARRRLRRGFVAACLGLVVALVAGSIALVQRHNANRQAEAADVARLVSLSRSLNDSKRDVAMLLAVEAARRSPGAATTSALQAALYTDPSFIGYLRTGTTPAGEVEFSPDSRELYTNGQDFNQRPIRVRLATRETAPVPVSGINENNGLLSFDPVDAKSAVLTRFAKGVDETTEVDRVDLADGRVLASVTVDGGSGTIAVSPDRKRVAVTSMGGAGSTGRVEVLNAATLAVVATTSPPGPALGEDQRLGSFSAWIDDHRLLVTGPSGRLRIWEPATGAVDLDFNNPPAKDTAGPMSVRVTPDGSRAVVNSLTGVMAYDLRTGAALWTRVQPTASAVALDPLHNLVWAQEAGAGSSRMFAYDLATGARAVPQLDGQHGTICGAKTSPNRRILALASCNEGVVALWALDGTTVFGPALDSAKWASSLDLWSPDGRYVVLFRLDDPTTVELVDVRDGTRRAVRGVNASAADAPIWRPDGKLQALIEDTNHIVEFDPRTGATHDTGVVLPGGHIQSNVARRGTQSVYGMDDGTLNVVDVAQARVVHSIKTDMNALAGVGWSPDGRRIFAAGQSQSAEVFDAATGKVVDHLPGKVANLIVSPDGRTMATAEFSGSVRLLDTTTLGQLGGALSGGAAFPAQLQFTPDGRTVITSGLDNTMRFFDVASRREVGTPLQITAWGTPISPDSKEMAISTDRGVERLSLDPGTLIAAACRASGRDLTAAEWTQYVGGTQRRLCPPFAESGPT